MNNPENHETFYLYCLWFYLPDIAKDRWENFETGIAIFMIQAFERRNK